MDTSDVYPDLFGDALSYSSQRMAQLASLFTRRSHGRSPRKARRNAAKTIRSERDLGNCKISERAAYELARAGWAPARDPRFLAQADLLQAARVWSAAAAYADADPPKPLMLSADARNGCVPCTRTRWPGMTAPQRRGRTARRECVRALPLFARARTHVPATPLLSAAACRPRTVLARHPGTAARTTRGAESLLIPHHLSFLLPPL